MIIDNYDIDINLGDEIYVVEFDCGDTENPFYFIKKILNEVRVNIESDYIFFYTDGEHDMTMVAYFKKQEKKLEFREGYFKTVESAKEYIEDCKSLKELEILSKKQDALDRATELLKKEGYVVEKINNG